MGRRGSVESGMSGNGEKPGGVNRRLAVLSRNDNGGGLQQILILQGFHHLANRCVCKLNLTKKFRRGVSGRVLVAAKNTVFNKLLSDADCLEIHTEDHRHSR